MRPGLVPRVAAGFALLAALAVLLPHDLCAQIVRFPTTQQTPDTVEAQRQEPRPIPVSRIPLRADSAFTRMRGLENQIRSGPDVRAVEQELPSELTAISASRARLERMVLESQSLRELRVLDEIWSGHEDRLAGWADTFESEWRDLQSAGSTLADISQTWDLTRAAAETDEGTPPEVMNRIRAVIEKADSLDTRIRNELGYLLGLESQLTDALEDVRDVRRDIEYAAASVRARTLQRNHPPVWRLPEAREEPVTETAVRMWGEDWTAARAFLGAHEGRLFITLLLFLFFLAAAVRLRSRIESEELEDDETLRGAADTLSRPVSAALLIVIIIASAMFPRAPVNMWEVVAVASVYPLYRLLPTSSVTLVNRAMRVVLLLFAGAAVAALLLPPSLEYRIFTLVLGIAVVVAAIGLLREADREAANRTGWGRLVWHTSRVIIPVAAFAVAAGVLGWSLLAELLVFGLVYGAYLGLGLAVGYRVLAGIVRLVPHSYLGQRSRILTRHGELISIRVIRAIRVGALLLWAWLTLELFYLADPLAGWVRSLFTGSVSVGIIEVSLGRVAGFLVILLLSVWIARFIRFVLDEEVVPRLQLKRGVGNAVSTVVQWTVLGLGLLTAAGALGLGAQQLAIVAGALGVGIGFGLQNIVNNFVSGLILIFEQPVKVGDFVHITALGLTGEVKKIGIRSSVVRDFDGAEVIVPNANLISSEVVNWTLSDQRRRIHTDVGVAYGTDPHRVIEILKGVADDHPEILRYPEPAVLFRGFGESSLDFRLLSWIGSFADFLRVRSELYVAAHDALVEAKITIPFPQRDLYLKSVPTSPDGSGGLVGGAQ